jgi:polyisoprenoid-binding protein YceI
MKKLTKFCSCLLFIIAVSLCGNASAQTKTITADNGKVLFTSNAPLEIIKATSDRLKGVIDTSKNTFAFAVEISSFKGFNGDLQREHFHENYMETDKFPSASFAGKFIEVVNYSTNGSYEVRAKGFFTIHGIKKERIIKGLMVVKNGVIEINAVFTVKLEDYDIKVPRIVNEKIAEEIKLIISIKFKA